jgi:hypothetical protein
MTKRPEVLIATDIVTKIAEGDAAVVHQLQSRREEYEDIVLIRSVLAEGIERANATVEGMHAIARLIGIARIVNVVQGVDEDNEADREELPRSFLPFQFFLKYILDPNAENVLSTIVLEGSDDPGFSGYETSIGQIVVALRCLQMGDKVNSKAFGLLLKEVCVNTGDEIFQGLDNLYLPEEFIQNTRAEVLGKKGA